MPLVNPRVPTCACALAWVMAAAAPLTVAAAQSEAAPPPAPRAASAAAPAARSPRATCDSLSGCPSTEGITFRFEEDAFLKLVPTTDRNYTGGGSIAFMGDWLRGTVLMFPQDRLDRLLGLDEPGLDEHFPDALATSIPVLDRHFSLELGLTAFAPKDLTRRDPVFGDRPYASLWYLASSRLTAFPSRGLAVISTFRIGLLGLDQARQIQSAIHKAGRPAGCSPDDPTCSAPEPRGWDNQISDGGEPTLGYGVQLEQLIAKVGLGVGCQPKDSICQGRTPRSFDAKLTLRGDIGYLTSSFAGATVRVGLIQTEFWGFDANPMAPATRIMRPVNADAAPASADSRRDKPGDQEGWRPELYAFAAAGGRATLYNALLQGQFRHSDVRVSFRDMRHLGYDYSLGLVAGVRWVQLVATLINGRSPEADFIETRTHRWASVFLTVLWAP